jgi:hypothetical protein
MNEAAKAFGDVPVLSLNEGQATQVERLVRLMAARTGETTAQVRRAVEIAIVTRGIAAVQEELG